MLICTTLEAFYPPPDRWHTPHACKLCKVTRGKSPTPATLGPGDWGKLEVNRRTVVPVRALHTWVTGSESDLAPVPVWLPVCLDGPTPEGAVVHSGLGAASLSRVMERSGQPGLSLPLCPVWVKLGSLQNYQIILITEIFKWWNYYNYNHCSALMTC